MITVKIIRQKIIDWQNDKISKEELQNWGEEKYTSEELHNSEFNEREHEVAIEVLQYLEFMNKRRMRKPITFNGNLLNTAKTISKIFPQY